LWAAKLQGVTQALKRYALQLFAKKLALSAISGDFARSRARRQRAIAPSFITRNR
jgi:hypothetical protein